MRSFLSVDVIVSHVVHSKEVINNNNEEEKKIEISDAKSITDLNSSVTGMQTEATESSSASVIPTLEIITK